MPDETTTVPDNDAERAAAMAGQPPQPSVLSPEQARAAQPSPPDPSPEDRERATAGGAVLSVTRERGALQVYGRGFEPNAVLRIEVDGVHYAGHRVGEDGTFTRAVPNGKRVAFVGPNGVVAADVAPDVS